MWSEMGIYLDRLSAIVIGNDLIPIIVIAQNSFDLSITDTVFVIYFVIADRFFIHTVFKVSELALWKKYIVLMQFKNVSLLYLMPLQSP